jgi:hypothetical protein
MALNCLLLEVDSCDVLVTDGLIKVAASNTHGCGRLLQAQKGFGMGYHVILGFTSRLTSDETIVIWLRGNSGCVAELDLRDV